MEELQDVDHSVGRRRRYRYYNSRVGGNRFQQVRFTRSYVIGRNSLQYKKGMFLLDDNTMIFVYNRLVLFMYLFIFYTTVEIIFSFDPRNNYRVYYCTFLVL